MGLIVCCICFVILWMLFDFKFCVGFVLGWFGVFVFVGGFGLKFCFGCLGCMFVVLGL